LVCFLFFSYSHVTYSEGPPVYLEMSLELFWAVIFNVASSSSLIHSSDSVIQQLIPSRVFLISVIVLFISVYSLFLLGPC